MFFCFFVSGGVLERNEIFNNKFDGICLATGVEPKLIGKTINCFSSWPNDMSEGVIHLSYGWL